MNKIQRKRFYYGLVLLAWVAYILLGLAAPKNTNSSSHVHLSGAVTAILVATIIIPYLLTWLIGMQGWYHFNRFVHIASRKHLSSTQGFKFISRGLGFLVFDLIVIPFFSSARNIWIGNQHAVVGLTVASNYTHTVLTLAAFGFLFYGSIVLARTSDYAKSVRSRIIPTVVPTIVFSVLFSLSVFNNPSRQTSSQPGVFATYYLSDTLILLTIIIPLAITWLLGLQAALNTERYVHSILEPRWKRAIIRYFHGLLAVLSSSIILQGITMIGSDQLQKINLVLILTLLYLFIVVQIWGYILIKSSAIQLHRLIKAGETHATH